VATPHLGAATSEAQENVALQIAEQMSDFLLTGAVTNAVNMPSVSAEEAPKLTPYVRLAELLGSFVGQLIHTGIRSVSIEFEGEVSQLNTRPLSASALTGLLAPQLEEINLVSAPAYAKDRNIQVSEVKREHTSDYHTLIRLVVVTDQGEHRISGTLIAGSKPRIVAIQGIPLEAELAPNMLFLRNLDKPGFIGNLGQTLGNAGVNIATFHLGRSKPGEDAILLAGIDQAVPDALLATVRKLPHVVEASSLRF
jgi:D-3-phosphoglycerate dehydrogenase